MFNRSLIFRALFVIFAPSAFIAGCEATATEKYCEKRCACTKCTETELDNCNDDADGLRGDAFRTDCRTKFDVYLACVSNDAICTEDGKYDESMCATAEMEMRTCINTAPTCASKNDGVCDEPAPAGNGKCPAGTDTNDCKVMTCASANDGVCDEPAPAGNGKCPAGTDTVDCTAPACASANDGVCDEPQGTNKCAMGTDKADCTCAHLNNNVCDEPEGTGLCPQASDSPDCMCATANDGVCDEPQGTNKCALGADKADCTCATENDGICDEPQGTGKCAMGTDKADCMGPCVTCADYATSMMGTLCTDSQPIYDALRTCACDGGCKADCTSSFCMGMTPNTACGMCLQAGACMNEATVCSNDI